MCAAKLWRRFVTGMACVVESRNLTHNAAIVCRLDGHKASTAIDGGQHHRLHSMEAISKRDDCDNPLNHCMARLSDLGSVIGPHEASTTQ